MNNFPIVMVHGFLGYGPQEVLGLSYWGQAAHALPAPGTSVHFASVGPLSSLHDRACELYAQIRGTRVDYGAQHAAHAGHARFGRDYSGRGFHPQWSAARPVHLVGHSMGGTTILMLQYLLAQKFWGGDTDANWIASVSAISSPLNGTTAVYSLGLDPITSRFRGGFTPAVRDLISSVIALTGLGAHTIYDFDLGHWGLTAIKDETLPDYLERIFHSNFLRGEDHAFHDLALRPTLALNEQRFVSDASTRYFAYVTTCSLIPFINGSLNPLLSGLALYMKTADLPQFYPGFDAADWRENDGVVPSASMYKPLSAHPARHPAGTEFGVADRDFAPGRWHWYDLPGWDHLNIVLAPWPWQIGEQRSFYQQLLNRLSAL